jgi:hypothetical protein
VLQALRELGTREQTGPREGDEAARDELTRRAGSYVQKDVDAWLAHTPAAHLGHYLLAELVHLAPGTGVDQLAFAARLAGADSEATGDLAAFLARARTGQS